MNESALHYRNWKDAEKSLEQATNEYDRGKPHFQNFPILKERLEKKKSIAEKGLSTTKATHDIKAKILTDCCRDLLSDRLNIRDIEDIVVTAREVIRGRDLQVNEEKLLDQSRAYIDTALTRARPTSQVDLSEIHAELQRLRIITERQDATIKEQQDSIVKMVTKHNGEIELLKKEFQETSSSSRSQISTMTGIVQGVKTEIHQQRTTTDESFLKVVSSVDDKIQKLVADMQELRVVCDRFGGFDKVSYELQSTVTSQNIDELRETTQRVGCRKRIFPQKIYSNPDLIISTNFPLSILRHCSRQKRCLMSTGNISITAIIITSVAARRSQETYHHHHNQAQRRTPYQVLILLLYKIWRLAFPQLKGSCLNTRAKFMKKHKVCMGRSIKSLQI